LKIFSALSIATVTLSSTFSVQAQQVNSASDIGDATVTVQFIPIEVTNTSTLDFGTLLPFGRPGSVTITTAGGSSPSDLLLIEQGTAAEWTVKGIGNAPYAVTLPTNISLTSNNGDDTPMTVNAFRTSARHLGYSTPTSILDAAGDGSFTVGATLNVGANQPAGIYTGNYEITVSYN